MTTGEAKANLEKLLLLYDDGMIDFFTIRESIKIAIKAMDIGEAICEAIRNDDTDLPTQMPGTSDLISRQNLLDLVDGCEDEFGKDVVLRLMYYIRQLPSAQPERDIPVKPIETTDTAWGIPHRQAVCPKCDYYLGHVAFLGDYKGRRITYCETCGQAIDWEGWNFDE